MAKIDLPYVKSYRDRHGKQRHYFRRKGQKEVQLKGDPTSPEFMEAYRLLCETEPSPKPRSPRHKPGSFGALVDEYLGTGAPDSRGSAEFSGLAESTQREYRRVMERLAIEHGSKPVALLQRRHIRRIRDERAETPGAANTLVRTIKLLMTFAIDQGYRTDNPAARMKLFKLGEWRSWTDEELQAFEAHWPSGSMQRRAYALALYTGQRRADVVAMTRSHIDRGKAIRVRQSKGQGEIEVWIPLHPTLRIELAHVPADQPRLLTTSESTGFDPIYFGAWFADAIEAAGLPEDCVLHGLRKAAARSLAEAGCTDSQIMAITGHTTSAMVRHYTKAAEKQRMATAAIKKWRVRKS